MCNGRECVRTRMSVRACVSLSVYPCECSLNVHVKHTHAHTLARTHTPPPPNLDDGSGS